MDMLVSVAMAAVTRGAVEMSLHGCAVSARCLPEPGSLALPGRGERLQDSMDGGMERNG
jgi:hypothetical protein